MIREDEKFWANKVLNAIENVGASILTYEGEKIIVRKALRAYLENAPTIKTYEDVISREAAIDALIETPREELEWDSGAETIRSLPSVAPSRPSGKWIDVKERKPSMSWDRNLVSLVRKDGRDVEEEIRISYYFEATDFLEETWSDIPMGYEVVAWMPLPEPYKESE